MAGSIPGPERRIVLVGKTRSVLSATGNTILGKEIFERGMSGESTTQICQKEEVLLKGRKVVVVNTPGFSDLFSLDITEEVSKCMKLCTPGPHVILQVMDPFFNFFEETYVAQQIKEIFGQKAEDYTTVLYTSENDLRGVISSSGKKEKECIGFNYMVKGEEREAQVAKLMIMIDDLVERNRDAPCYTEDMMNVSKTRNF